MGPLKTLVNAYSGCPIGEATIRIAGYLTYTDSN